MLGIKQTLGIAREFRHHVAIALENELTPIEPVERCCQTMAHASYPAARKSAAALVKAP